MDCEAIGYVIGDVDVLRAACSSIIDVVKLTYAVSAKQTMTLERKGVTGPKA